jgi:hypothetical protein
MTKKHRRHCVLLCREVGLNPVGVEQRGKHWAIVCREGKVFCPCTPSDHRFRHNFRAAAKRLLVGGL